MWNSFFTAEPMNPFGWDWSLPKFSNDSCGTTTFHFLFFSVTYIAA
jgi:hypothetical protein